MKILKFSVVLKKPIPDMIMLDSYEQGRPRYRLQEGFEFDIRSAEGGFYLPLTVPVGLVFDCASVPRGFWNVFPPADPKYLAASLIHDWACAGELWPVEVNNAIFREAMRARNTPAWKRTIMYWAVCIGCKATYKSHRPASIMRVRSLSMLSGQSRPLWKDFEHTRGMI